MKYILVLLFILTIFLGINLLPPKRYSYTGSVVDELNHPIATAKLSFYFKGVEEVIKETETNEQGKFSLMSNYRQLEKVVVVKDGYDFSLEKSQENNGVVFSIIGKKK